MDGAPDAPLEPEREALDELEELAELDELDELEEELDELGGLGGLEEELELLLDLHPANNAMATATTQQYTKPFDLNMI